MQVGVWYGGTVYWGRDAAAVGSSSRPGSRKNAAVLAAEWADMLCNRLGVTEASGSQCGAASAGTAFAGCRQHYGWLEWAMGGLGQATGYELVSAGAELVWEGAVGEELSLRQWVSGVAVGGCHPWECR